MAIALSNYTSVLSVRADKVALATIEGSGAAAGVLCVRASSLNI